MANAEVDFKAVDYNEFMQKNENKPVKPNDVFMKNGEWYIVMEIRDGQINRTEKLRDYVARSYIMPFKGKMLSINEIIDQLCQGFIGRS